MGYDVNIVASCDSDVWNTNTEKFPATIKSLIDDLNVDYKFRIISGGVQRTSFDSEDTIGISRHFTSGLKAAFTVDSLSDVQTFENNLASACMKLDTNYKLRVRLKNHLT